MSCGYKVKNTEKYGRVLVATKVFKAGDIVLQDKPLLRADENGLSNSEEAVLLRNGLPRACNKYISFLKEFSKVDKSTQDEVLDLYCPPAAVLKTFEGWMLMASVTKKKFSWAIQFDLQVLERVIGIININGHGSGPKLNIYKICSKSKHSCDPNCMISNGRLIVIRHVQTGEALTCSYIDSFLDTQSRQEVLKRHYLFECDCSSCTSGVDLYGGLLCEECAGAKSGPIIEDDYCRTLTDILKQRKILGTKYRSQQTGKWICDTCGSSKARYTSRVTDLKGRALAAEGNGNFVDISATLKTALFVLGTSHYITHKLALQWLNLVETMCSMGISFKEDTTSIMKDVVSLTDMLLDASGKASIFSDERLLAIGLTLLSFRKFKEALKFLLIFKEQLVWTYPSHEALDQLLREAIDTCKTKTVPS